MWYYNCKCQKGAGDNRLKDFATKHKSGKIFCAGNALGPTLLGKECKIDWELCGMVTLQWIKAHSDSSSCKTDVI